MLTSICLCTYEKTERLTQTLQGIARHAHSPYEVVVVDDASKNPEVLKTLTAFKNLFEKSGVPFSIFVNPKNSKHAASQNKSWELAKGDILIHIEDDIVVPHDGWNISMGEFLNSHPEVGIAFPEGSGRGEWIPHAAGYNEFQWGLGGLFAIRRELFDRGLGWDPKLIHQVEVDFCFQVRMEGLYAAEVPAVRMLHLGEGEENDTFSRQAQIVVGVHQFLHKWNSRFLGDNWDYDNLWSMSADDFPMNANFRRRLAAWFAAEAEKLENRYRGLKELKDDPKYAGAVPPQVKKAYDELVKMRLNADKRPFKFYGHWGAFELINVVRPQGREREPELINLMKNDHFFKGARRIEKQLIELAARMNHPLTPEELNKWAAMVPLKYSWKGEGKYVNA